MWDKEIHDGRQLFNLPLVDQIMIRISPKSTKAVRRFLQWNKKLNLLIEAAKAGGGGEGLAKVGRGSTKVGGGDEGQWRWQRSAKVAKAAKESGQISKSRKLTLWRPESDRHSRTGYLTSVDVRCATVAKAAKAQMEVPPCRSNPPYSCLSWQSHHQGRWGDRGRLQSVWDWLTTQESAELVACGGSFLAQHSPRMICFLCLSRAFTVLWKCAPTLLHAAGWVAHTECLWPRTILVEGRKKSRKSRDFVPIWTSFVLG
ncbi:hypothetical protein B0H13DRAFT_2472531 [Mycena leptocephala]|nr:hypothetical protein B0H13DRAFT_2472531 [Mycena leptocephala]